MRKFWERIGTTEIRNIIAIISVIGAFVLLFLIIIKPIPVENKDTMNMAIGIILGGLIAGINGYFFGASKNAATNKSDN